MSRIIYGLSGQGFGHSARGHEVLTHLKKKGHELLVLTYAQALGVMKADFPTLEIPGLGLNYQNNKVDYLRTLYDNAAMLVRSGKNWPALLRKIKRFKADLVISDYEPLSAAYAHLEKLPLVSFDNQHQMTNTKIIVPKKYRRDLLAAKLVTRSFVWGADHYLITTFFQTPVSKPDTFLFPPVVRRQVARLKPAVKDYILVYQNSDFDYILPELKKLAPQKFVVFSSRPDEIKDGNLVLKHHDPAAFLQHLKNCRAIIATAGLSLISEAIRLDKPYFAIPVAKQVEQTINALYIKKLGFGDWAETFSAARGRRFMGNLEKFRRALKNNPKENTDRLFEKLDEIIAAHAASQPLTPRPKRKRA